MLPLAADRPKLRATLDQLSAAVEDLLLGGLTTASDATRQTLSGALQEAARLRLLRLGSTLRGATEELGRFTRQDANFSRRRLTFFLNRAWLLSRGMGHALQTSDEKEFDRLTWSPLSRPVPSIDVVCLGVSKKVAEKAFVAFEFRLRVVGGSGAVPAGQPLAWSAVFPIKAGVDVPPEGFLHLPQKQKFAPFLFLEKKVIAIQNAMVSGDESGVGRLTLTDQSTVVLGKPFGDWGQFLKWSPETALKRLTEHVPGPLDLDTELQEEVLLTDPQIDQPGEGDEPGQTVYPIASRNLKLAALVGAALEGKALKKCLDELRKLKRNRPNLFGLMHYERCRLLFQPLSAFYDSGPDYLTISKENVDKRALLKAMALT